MPTIMRSRTMASPLSLPLLFLLLPYIHAKTFHSNLHRVGGRHVVAHHNSHARHGPVHHGPKYHTGQHHGGGQHGHHGPVHRTPSHGVAHHGGHPVHNAPNHGVAHQGGHEQHPVHNVASHGVAHHGSHEQYPVHNAPNHGVAHQGGHEQHPSQNTQNFHPEPTHGVEAHEGHELHVPVHNTPESHPGLVHEPKHSQSGGQWKSAHATFYGGKDGSETMGGACGYQQGYGLQTAALSQVMFNNGQTCGACYEIRCVNSPQWCKLGQPSLFVTATNLCPPNYNIPSDNGGWCNPPREHFDLSQPAYLQIAEYKAGIVPVEYRRVPCKKEGGMRFTIKGNPYFTLVLVTNVGGAGDITSVEVKGDKKVEWTPMKRNWGQNWETHTMLVGESLTFRVKLSDGKSLTSWHVTPENWQFGQTFEGKNFN